MEEQLLEIPAPDYDDEEVDDNDVMPDVTPDVSDAVITDANDNISPWDDDAVVEVAAAADDDEVAAVVDAEEENSGTRCSADRWEDDEDGQVFRVLKEKLERYSADEIRQMLASASGVTEAEGGDDSIPDPDYSDDDGENACPASNEVFQSTNKDSTTITSRSDRKSEQPNNANKPEVPLLKERKNLQRELKLMQKLGVESVLEKKPELIKVLEDRKEKNKKKELDAYLKTKRSSFEAKLEEQANKLNLAEEQKEREANPTKTEAEETEFLKMHSKIIRTKSNDCSN